MKQFLLLLLISFTTIGFSQAKPTFYLEKIKEMDSITLPSPKNDLSKYFRKNIDPVLLENYKINEMDSNHNHVYLGFKLNKEGKPISIEVSTPYSEIKNSIIEAFKNYDIEKLHIPDRNPLNQYMLQILSRDGGKMIINCSTNIVYDRFPVYEGCESNTTYSQMESCFTRFLENYVANNISPEQIKKAKVMGVLSFNPRFVIDEKGMMEKVIIKDPKDSLLIELKRIMTQLPVAKIPPLRNGKPTKLPLNRTINFEIVSDNKEYIADVIKSKDSTLNPNNELALHFKKFLSKEEVEKIFFGPGTKSIRIQFGIDKKGKIIDLKTNAINPNLNSRIIEVFRSFPVEKLNINSTNKLESYSYTIISKADPVNVIQCNDKPNVYIPPIYDKSCEKSDSAKELMNCYQENIQSHFFKIFDSKVRNKTNLTGTVKIYCTYEIDIDGKVSIKNVKAPNPSLAKELEETIKKLPNFYKPAYVNGVAVKSTFRVPVVFELGEKIPESTNTSRSSRSSTTTVNRF